MPDVAPPGIGVPGSDLPEPEIHVIPEKFYGAALKARVTDQSAAKTDANALVQPSKKRTGLVVAIVVIVLLLGTGGAFLYFNQNLLFPPPAPPAPLVVVTPPPAAPTPPSAPANTVATSTNPQSAAVSWVDTASDESGFRIERAEDTGQFQSLTNLPPNSTSFLDTSVQAGKTYRYRVIASNQGGDSAPSPEASATVPPLPPPPPEAPKLPPAGLDTDSDGLSDLEEALFNTNSRNPDTDGDGFLDGNEVFHLYNPGGRAPGKMLDAKLVKPVNGTVGWNMLIPVAWTITQNVDGTIATVSSGHGEAFKLTIEDNPKQLTIVDWYLASHLDVQASQIMEYRSKQGYTGIIGADMLTTYIPWGDRVFVYAYLLDDQPFINFRTTYSMMLNSLQLQGLPQVTAPEANAAPLPFEPAATATGVIAQPVPVTEAPPQPTPVETVTSTVPATTTSAEPTSTPPIPPPPTP
jgi:hypothetical protein